MSDLPAAFYVRDGGLLRASALTRGPWDDEHQHGGPPAALLAGAIAQAEPEAGAFRLARVMVEFLRPIPISGGLEIRCTARRGWQAQRVEASLYVDGVELVRASGLRLRTSLVDPGESAPARPLAPPDSIVPFHFPFFRTEPAYHSAMDIRIVEGRWGTTPIGVWGRARVPLILGQETTAIERATLLADAESGIGPPIDPEEYMFVNPELTVHFARAPEGEWIGMRVTSKASQDGIGVAESELLDHRGPFGRAAQALFIRPRSRASQPPTAQRSH